jgi:hypothetical protein
MKENRAEALLHAKLVYVCDICMEDMMGRM